MYDPSTFTIASLHMDILKVSEFQQANPGELMSDIWVEAMLSPVARTAVKKFIIDSPQSWVDMQTSPTWVMRILLEALWMHSYPGSPRWGVTP